MVEIKPSHRGLLHRDLGVPVSQPIPAAALESAENSDSAALRRRAVFAENAKGFNHRGVPAVGSHARRPLLDENE